LTFNYLVDGLEGSLSEDVGFLECDFSYIPMLLIYNPNDTTVHYSLLLNISFASQAFIDNFTTGAIDFTLNSDYVYFNCTGGD
jgi:hypothetical protein